jgi:uncharacterized membrane protein YczE
MARRLLQLYLGLVAYGVSMVLMLQSGLGLMPWDVLHQGLALQSGWPMGRVTVAVSFLVLLAWIPIRQRPGLGTISNAIVVGLVFDATMMLMGDRLAGMPLAVRTALLLGGIALNALATAAYIGADFGPGPRDGLMTGLARRSGRSLRLIRTGIEAGVLLTGWLLGGTFGVGTLLYAIAIGPLIQFTLRWFQRPPLPAATTIARDAPVYQRFSVTARRRFRRACASSRAWKKSLR